MKKKKKKTKVLSGSDSENEMTEFPRFIVIIHWSKLLWLNSHFIDWNSDSSQVNFEIEEIIRIGLVSLFNGISTFVGYLMPKPFP